MAFDFERYLQSYESPNAEFYKNKYCVSPLGNINDEIPGVTKFSELSKEADSSTPQLLQKPKNGEQLPPLDRLLGNSSRGSTNGVDVIESRFRSSQDLCGKLSGRGKTGLFKQTSLPASLGGYGGSRTKTENTGRRRRNSVRFADEVGENLTTFLLIPSRFEEREQDKDASAKKTLSHDASTSVADKHDISTNGDHKTSTAVSTDAKTDQMLEKCETPSFQLCFDQPAANLEDFRRRLFFQFVCLENVKVDVKSHTDGTANGFVNHGIVLCTIKVRNLHPMKRVFARCTDNNWKTYADIFAVYVSDGTSRFNEYDTFTFALRNPLRYQGTASNDTEVDSYCRKTASVEFALCYEVLGSTYWDNNSGHNYKIVWM